MLNSTVLEVMVGLVFAYAAIALVASALYETFASLFKLRAATLLTGVKELLNDKEFSGLARELYNHALINPRHDGKNASRVTPKIKPSYIDSQNFAIALIETIQGASGTATQLKTQIDAMEDGQLKRLLEGMFARAKGDAEKLQAELAKWFDSGMQRVSGTYKRHAQLVIFLIGIAVAALLNVDSCQLFRSLWQHPALVAQIGTSVGDQADTVVSRLSILPIGWAHTPTSVSELLSPAPGWLVTAICTLFGAPFWFDLLQKLVNLRGSGSKPGSTA